MEDESAERKRLAEAKLERKKKEDDARTLANRIALLESEEKKALKKIQETKKKAEEITNLKIRNKEQLEAKQNVLKLGNSKGFSAVKLKNMGEIKK